jgi:prevent-host-death family protein
VLYCAGQVSSDKLNVLCFQPCKARDSYLILVVDSYILYEWYTAMARLNVSKAREEFSEVVNRAAYGKERTIVSRRGKDLAAVIPVDDLRLLERLAQEEMDRIDLEDARAALREAEEKGTIPLEEARKRLSL